MFMVIAAVWLQAYVDEVEAEARAGGAYGTGIERHSDGLVSSAPLPAGAELATVNVLYRGWAFKCCENKPNFPRCITFTAHA